jgi:tRNA uridine 5-carboxymethylaminomethyl modification enzyme
MIPENFNYMAIPGLSKELQQKLTKHKPQSIAHAALIPGMTPAAISLLIFRVCDFTKNFKRETAPL